MIIELILLTSCKFRFRTHISLAFDKNGTVTISGHKWYFRIVIGQSITGGISLSYHFFKLSVFHKFMQFFLVPFCFIFLYNTCNTNVCIPETRESKQIESCYTVVQKLDNRLLAVYFSIQATGEMDILGASSISIERFEGSKWVTEYTYTSKGTPTLQTENDDYYDYYLPYSPLFPDAEYRATITFYAQSSWGTSTYVVHTSSTR